jgi:hypothetical protein
MKRKEVQKSFACVNLGCLQKIWIFKTKQKASHAQQRARARFTRRLNAEKKTQNVRTKKVLALSGVLIFRDDARFLILICLLFFFFFSFLCLETKTLSNWKRKGKNY